MLFFYHSVYVFHCGSEKKRKIKENGSFESWKTFTNICFVVFCQLTGPSNAHSFSGNISLLFPGETEILYRSFQYLVVFFNIYNMFKPQ